MSRFPSTSPYAKRTSHKAALLTLLSDGKWHRMDECQRVGGYRYGGRLHELRKAGHVIEGRTYGPDLWEYRLVREGQGALL